MAGFRAGRSDPGTGARPGSDPAASRGGLSGGRPGAPLSAARAGGGLPLRLRLHAEGHRTGCCIRATMRRALEGMACACRACGRGAGLCARAGADTSGGTGTGSASERAVNGWGGFSKATTRALQSLHYHGLLRVARRRDGIRIYEAARRTLEPLPPAERRRRLRVAGDRAYWHRCPSASLAATFGLLGRGAPGVGRVAATACGAAEVRRSGERRG